LVLRPVEQADADGLHELWSSAGVRRFLWDDQIVSLDRTREAIEQSRSLFASVRHGLWGAWSLSDNRLAGFGGLWPFREPELELLYGVAEPLWGRGYAGEMARAVIGYCFDTLALPVIRASTDVANAASVRVLEKLGFRFVTRVASAGLDTVFYELQPPLLCEPAEYERELP
jgi:RimJ/RimL family protein N-acetyltransferase